MFDLRRLPVARLLFPFAGGSLAGHQMEYFAPLRYVLLICFLIWIILVILFIRQSKRNGIVHFVFGNLAMILFVAAGYATGLISKPDNPGLPEEEKVMISAEVLEEPYPGNRTWVVEMKLCMVVSRDSSYVTRTRLKAYLKMPADSILPSIGETWQMFGQLSPIRNNGNPGEPDYEEIMHRKNCWYRFFADSRFRGNGRVEDRPGREIRAASIRQSISGQWRGDPKVASLLKAVCLGDRSGLTNDLRQSYTTAGGMHLLAVSGLHVGLIWLVLHHSLGWIVRLLRRELYRALMIIVLLWFYAFVTGFSSSVSRSVTMFTFVTVSGIIDRRTHPVNGILVSAFVLMLINPGRLLDVGFQLSYAAILGIVTLYPIIKSLLKVKNRVMKWVWEVTIISLTAQLTTLPLVVYYFHQLPSYSLFTNLLAVPLLSGLIALFVISVPFMAIGMFTGVFNKLLFLLGNLMNRSMELIASIPGATLEDLYLDQLNLLLLMIIVFLVMYVLNYRITLPRYILLFMVSALLAWSSWNRYNGLQTAELVVLHFNGCSLVTFREGRHVDHYYRCRDSTGFAYMSQYMATTWDSRRFETCTFEICDSMQIEGTISGCCPIDRDLWLLGNDRIKGWMVTGSSGQDHMHLLADRQADFILLSGEPRLQNLSERGGMFQCDLIVDGSNRMWYTRGLEIHNEPIHFTSHHGAYLKRW
jgi:competence protein ComEC